MQQPRYEQRAEHAGRHGIYDHYFQRFMSLPREMRRTRASLMALVEKLNAMP